MDWAGVTARCAGPVSLQRTLPRGRVRRAFLSEGRQLRARLLLSGARLSISRANFPVTTRERRRTLIDLHVRSTPAGGSSSLEERNPDFLRRLAARDRDALGRFYELFFDRIFGYVRRLVVEEHLAEDVTQEVFVHIQRSIAAYDPTRDLSPWVFTIAANKVRDHWRSRRHHDAQRETSFDGEDGEMIIDPVDGRLGPLFDMESRELRSTLDSAITELPIGMRETLVLRWFEELPFDEIGRMIGRNETAVRKRYSRALEELRRVLDKQVGPGGVA